MPQTCSLFKVDYQKIETDLKIVKDLEGKIIDRIETEQ